MTTTPHIEAEAAAWVGRMDGGLWDEAQEAELQTWLARDPRHRGALLQMQAAWETPYRESVAGDAVRFDSHAHRLPATRRRLIVGGGGAIAASLVAGLVWAAWPTELATKVGEIRRVPLADGSVATINTASRIEVDLADTRRDIRLDAGEVWFQVAKDRRRPFTVAAGRARVRAVGTAFSVRRFAGGAEVLVTEGVVEAWADGADGHRIRLVAGQGAFVADNAAITSEPARPVTIERALAWRGGKIDLVDKPLGEALAEFNRYNERQLVLGDPALAEERIDGVFWIGDPAGFAAAVQSAFDTQVDLSDPARIRVGGDNL